MKVLGIDTATAVASAALVEDGKLILEEVRRSPGEADLISGRGNHAETLLPLIDELLRRAGLALEQITAIAVSIGPGSFTGLRIGLSTVKGLAYGSKVPVVGVPTLIAVATRVIDWEGLICPFLDARKKEVYAALFQKRSGRLNRLMEDLAAAPQRVVDRVQAACAEERCLFIGDGIKTYGPLLQKSLGVSIRLTLGETYPSTASAVARLGEEMVCGEGFPSLSSLGPIYLRPSEAELKRRL